MFTGVGYALDMIIATDNTPGEPWVNGGGTEFDPVKPGIELEIYKAIAEILNLNIEFRRLPWKLCLQQLEHGKVDGIFPASFKEERLKLGVYPMKNGSVDTFRKTRDNAYYLYKTKDDPITWNGKEFKHISGPMGAPLGWAVVDDLIKMNLDIKEVPVHVKTLEMLLSGRLNGFVCLESVFDSYISNEPDKYKDIVKVSPSIWEKPYYLMLSHQFVQNNPDLAEKIWNEISNFKSTIEFQKINLKYTN